MAVAGLLGASLNSYIHENNSSNSFYGVPAYSVNHETQPFNDDANEISRNFVRDFLNESMMQVKASERETIIKEQIDELQKTETLARAKEREIIVNENLAKVEKERLKREKQAEIERVEAEETLEWLRENNVEPSSINKLDVTEFTSDEGSMPIKANYRIGAHYGQVGLWSRYHTGQDFPAPQGTKVYAAGSGIVQSPVNAGWAGTNIVIKHDDGSTLYAHLSGSLVENGDIVQAGDLIGYVGNTGRSFGAHLHFEFYKPSETPGDVYNASNPVEWLTSHEVKVK